MKKAKKKELRNLINSSALYCCICGELILNVEEATKEHEPPLSRGGQPGKWQWAHKRCNNVKGALTIEEYKMWLLLENKRNGR